MQMGKRNTVLIICQVYAPDPAAVGQQVTDAAEELAARGWRVVVYTSRRGYDDPSRRYAWRESRNGVDVRRLPLSSFGKSSIAIRLVAQGLFMLQAVVRGLLVGQLAVVIVSTSPPFAGPGGVIVSLLRRVPLVWWVMDLNPDQMIAAGKIARSSFIARVFDFLNRLTLRSSDAVIVLDRFMADRVNAKQDVARKLRVVPPWPPTSTIDANADCGTSFRSAHGLAGRFVVMYSGNHAIQHPLDTLLAAADRFAKNPEIVFVFVGGGAGKAAVDDRVAAGASNIVSLPFQPLETIGESLAAGDVHAVSMGDEVVGIVHPCKIYGAMAAGRPVLFFGPECSHGGEIIRDAAVGWRIDHGDVDAAVAAIREAAAQSEGRRHAIRRRAAEAMAGKLSRAALRGELCDLIEEVGGRFKRVSHH